MAPCLQKICFFVVLMFRSWSPYVQLMFCLCSTRVFLMFNSCYFETKRFSLKQNVSKLKRLKHKMMKCFKPVSWWPEILFNCYLLQWVDPLKDQLDQKNCGLKCFPWHWDQRLKKHFNAFFAFWNACFNVGLLMNFCLFDDKIMSSCSAHCVLCWALFLMHSVLVFIQKPMLEKAEFDGCAMVSKKRSGAFQAMQNKARAFQTVPFLKPYVVIT